MYSESALTVVRVRPSTVTSARSAPGSTPGLASTHVHLQLKRYDERGWRATFYTIGMEHSPTSATGTGWERTPWHATQRAAWVALETQEEP